MSQLVAEKSLTEKCPYKSDRRKNELLNKEGKMRISNLIFIYTIQFACLKVYTKLKTLAPIEAEKSVTEISAGVKEKRTNKGTDKQYVAVFCYTIKLITIKLCTKFQNHKSSSW